MNTRSTYFNKIIKKEIDKCIDDFLNDYEFETNKEIKKKIVLSMYKYIMYRKYYVKCYYPKLDETIKQKLNCFLISLRKNKNQEYYSYLKYFELNSEFFYNPSLLMVKIVENLKRSLTVLFDI